MADDSVEIQKDEVPFHPCLTPRGMAWYDLNVLTPLQQKLLNEFKVDVIRENNQYLARHPEIRAIIALFLRAVLRDQPNLKTIADYAKDFFSRPQVEIQAEITEYLKEKGEPKKKEGDSAVNLEVEPPSIRSSLVDLTSIYQHGYYTYVTYTDEPSSVEEVEDWGTDEDIERLLKPPSSFGDKTYFTSSTDVTDTEYERRQFELLFASRASLLSVEGSIEASTIDMTKEYMSYYGEGPQDANKPEEPLDDEESKRALEEMTLAEEIEVRLSIILENLEDEAESEEGYYEYREQLSKKSVIEMDIESLKQKSFDENVFEEETGPSPSQKTSVILETMLEYESAAEGEGEGEGEG